MLIVARIFGFIRYRVLTGYFSTSELDLFFAAFRIPDIVFEILITGALTTSFIPFYIKYNKNKEAQSVNISSIINIIMILLLAAIALLSILLPHIMFIIAPGFDEEKTKTIAFFSQLLLIGQLPFLVIGNFLTGISQARKIFFLPAIAPIIYNLAIITMTLLFYHSLYLLAPVLGVVVGAFLFLLIQIPTLITGDFQFRFVIQKSRALWDFFRVAAPRIFTVMVSQIDATVDLTLATLLGAGSFTIFYLAQHLQLLPVSVIGMAFGQASLPYLTELYQEKNINQFKRIVVDSILNLFYLSIPIMSFLIFARTPIVRLFFGGQQFDWQATNLTAVTLSYFAISLPFHAIYYFLTRCFYALFDSKTPFFISLATVAINAVLSILLTTYFKFPVWSLAAAFSTAIIINVIVLLFVLYKRLNGYDISSLIYETIKICLATLISSIAIYYLQKLLDGLIFDTTRTINVFLLLAGTGIAYFMLYLFLTWLLNVKEMYLLSKMVLKVKEYQKRILEIYSGINDQPR